MRRYLPMMLGIGGLVIMGLGVLFWVGKTRAQGYEAYIRAQASEYLSERFDADAQIGSLTVQLPQLSPFYLLTSQSGRIVARVEGNQIVLKRRGEADGQSLLEIRKFYFDVDVVKIMNARKELGEVYVEGMKLTIPPKGERGSSSEQSKGGSKVLIDHLQIKDATLTLVPKRKDRKPLEFQLHQIDLQSAGHDMQMNYQATLTNPRPKGLIKSSGKFGPWKSEEPADTPLEGTYDYSDADLGVFSGIGGVMQAKGKFAGSLSNIHTTGVANVPDFHLKKSGNPVPLYTRFEAEVDGTNGNTILKPVVARLGSTNFQTSGAIVKHEGENGKGIDLDVVIPNGQMRDVLRLAMKGTPMMEGVLNLKAKIYVPPLKVKVIEKLRLAGDFHIQRGHFLKMNVQDQIDGLSRRGQGQPKNEEIDEVFSEMQGRFTMANQSIRFERLSFGVPGAAVDLAGEFDLGEDELDFHGSLRLAAKVSQTQTGIKRLLLKPVDPFFSKNGAGTFVAIQVLGSSKAPKFGRDKKKDTKGKGLPGSKAESVGAQ